MFHVVLFQPEIPPNTGNIIRLCANCGAQLHLIRPLGFDMSHKQLRRAGLDYHEFSKVQIHDTLEAFVQTVEPARLFACSTKGQQNYTGLSYAKGDAFLFGPETRGLPADILDSLPREQLLRIPMLPDNRSLNLSNATAIIIYEAWRQQGFVGASA
ncbi:MAG TPA: tRNA (uridine(34)/cytosine(34)/5-carboxymethylaminomethyluridine(34)-2'-O)-methyltransferase TrmL [Gammaproteobacteria bacterium]|nr:tRNA (uridine(34)/cytosine(34)/5-carboxymethylaminomethyluridine(34)-2'-O)-methyltransferase TrmL [Gammaproteobacteria bacterium]